MRWLSVLTVLSVALLALSSCASRKTPRQEALGPAASRSEAPQASPSGSATAPVDRKPAPVAPVENPGHGAPAVGLEVRPVTAEGILAMARKPGSQAVLVNVWATWCAPCREEFPDLMRLYRNYRGRGLKLVLVSADFDARQPAVKRFLAKHGVDFESYIKTGDDMQFINGLDPKWTGSIPATFIYDRKGRLAHFHEGMASYDEFEQQLLEVLNADHPDSLKGNRS